MGRPATELLLRGFFNYCISDLRKNSWLLADIFNDAAHDPLTQVEIGDREYLNAFDWFKNNDIQILLEMRRDHVKFPSISISLGGGQEMIAGTTIGDVDQIPNRDIWPEEFDRPMPTKILRDFTPSAYDPTTGTITLPTGFVTTQVAPGIHMIVEPDTGKGYVINKILSLTSFQISPNVVIDLKNIYVTPTTTAWNCERGRTRFTESYEIGCHANSDPIEAVWLAQLVEYCLLKYKPKFLEHRNIILSTYSYSAVSKNQHYEGDNVYSRFLTLNFQVEMDFIVEIARKATNFTGEIYIIDGPKTPAEYLAGALAQGWAMVPDRPPPPPRCCSEWNAANPDHSKHGKKPNSQ